ncbi:hypothetical protein [Streptomyces halobius]|uniref:Uncharacterized protein n=1 Tax=Streptomyces halobius TaxID=2879846 RepID=A0ABY4ME47_9ACTN|nr:hypothetical protein [Streptomyces halobius]UQA96050.1 hypothetical protein K9S39_32975 [Streptomyces halobius]
MKCVLEKSSSVAQALLSTENDDGTYGLVELEITWEFGPVVSGRLPARGRAARNLVVRPEVVFNLAPAGTATEEGAVTSADGCPSTADAALTEPSEMVRPPRLAHYPLQLEARCVSELTVTDGAWTRFEAQVLRVHADPRWVLPRGDRGVELSAWAPPVHDFRSSGTPPREPVPVPARELAERLGRRFPAQRDGSSTTRTP